jgi:hypothetical protein
MADKIAAKSKSQGQYPRIMVGLPDIQDQIRMINRLSATAAEPDLGRWNELGELLSDLYSQLQSKKQVTVYRYGSKTATAVSSRRPVQRAG